MKFYGVLPILLIPALLVGQANIFGDFESEFDRLTISDQSYNYGYNKLRLDLDHTASEGVTFGANINIQRYYGNVQWNLLDFLPGEIKDILKVLGIQY